MRNRIGIHHVQVAMPSGRDSDARFFYGELLGLTEIDVPESLRSRASVWYSTGSIDLHIGVQPDFAPAKKAHVAYQVDDLDAAARRLEEAGHPVSYDTDLPGYRRFYTEDPFGNRVEILIP